MEPAVLQLMESIVKDKDACAMMSSLFQTIANDMKGSQPLWEEFVKHAARLHSCLKATLLAISSYLDSFQRIADTASAAKGATRDIGTALTRICLRHRAVEAKVKTFASALAECLILPMQRKLDDWRRTAASLEKEHARDYKRQRYDLKKRTADTLRLYKKVRKTKTSELQRVLDSQASDIQERYRNLEESERTSLSAAMVEERGRYCRFVSCLQPVVQGEVSVIGEMVHLSEVMNQLEQSTIDPHTLPAASEQVIGDLKGTGDAWRLVSTQGSTQGSPCHSSSLGSRQSSVCSVSSLASAGSVEPAMPPTPTRPRSLSHAAAAPAAAAAHAPGGGQRASRDSGFTSQDPLPAPASASAAAAAAARADRSDGSADSSVTVTPASPPPHAQRPHTISSAYERGGSHQRPMLGGLTFVAPRPPPAAVAARHLSDRPPVPAKSERARTRTKAKVYSHYACPARAQLPDFNLSVPDMVVPQPLYSNLAELNQLAPKEDCTTPTPGPDTPTTPELDTPTTPTNCLPKFERCESDGSASSGYGSVHTAPPVQSLDAFPPPPDFVLNNFCCGFEDVPQAGRPVYAAKSRERAGRPPAGLRRCVSQSARPPPPLRRHSASAPGWPPQRSVSEAVRTLNAAQHRPACPAPAGAAALLRLASFSAADAGQRQRSSLLDQIRRGTPLRQTLTAGDRPPPTFRS